MRGDEHCWTEDSSFFAILLNQISEILFQIILKNKFETECVSNEYFFFELKQILFQFTIFYSVETD